MTKQIVRGLVFGVICSLLLACLAPWAATAYVDWERFQASQRNPVSALAYGSVVVVDERWWMAPYSYWRLRHEAWQIISARVPVTGEVIVTVSASLGGQEYVWATTLAARKSMVRGVNGYSAVRPFGQVWLAYIFA